MLGQNRECAQAGAPGSWPVCSSREIRPWCSSASRTAPWRLSFLALAGDESVEGVLGVGAEGAEPARHVRFAVLQASEVGGEPCNVSACGAVRTLGLVFQRSGFAFRPARPDCTVDMPASAMTARTSPPSGTPRTSSPRCTSGKSWRVRCRSPTSSGVSDGVRGPRWRGRQRDRRARRDGAACPLDG